MTGGGFGGCTINVVRGDNVHSFTQSVAKEYRDAMQIDPDVYIVCADDGVREEIVPEPGT